MCLNIRPMLLLLGYATTPAAAALLISDGSSHINFMSGCATSYTWVSNSTHPRDIDSVLSNASSGLGR
jgi:hypothetical protein